MSDLSTDPSTTPIDTVACVENVDGTAPADGSAERRRPRFICEYEYTDDLLTRFARMQVSAKRRGALLLMGCIEIAIGLLWIFSPQSLHWAGFLI